MDERPDGKQNQILFGCIVMLLGVLLFVQNALHISLFTLTVCGVGFALIVLYKTKRKTVPLFLGSYLFGFGALGFLSDLFAFPQAFTRPLTAGSFFIIPGVIFLVMFLDKKRHGFLIPAGFLLWIGLFIAGFAIPGYGRVWYGMFFILSGVVALAIKILGQEFFGRGLSVAGFCFAGFGFLLIFLFGGGIGLLFGPAGVLQWLLIILGIFIIVKAVFHKKQG